MPPPLFVSVIMPIRNESAYIERSLGSVLNQDYPHNHFEVIIADGGSTDDTLKKINALAHIVPDVRVRVINNPMMFMPMGFNLGLQEARGDVVIMLGGHAEIAPDYLSQSVKLLNETPAWCVGGAMETLASGLVSQAIATAMSSVFGVGGVAFRTLPKRIMEVDTAVFAAYRIEVFHKIGCLDEEMIRNQDDEFNYRLREQGGKILFSPGICSKYYSRATLSSLWRQYFQYGFYKVRVLQKHPLQMSSRQFAPPLFVFSLFLSLILSFIPEIAWMAWVVPFVYLLANLGASFWIAWQKPHRSIVFLPVVFAILHFSYGLGFLMGLFKFWNRWNDKTGKIPALIKHESNI